MRIDEAEGWHTSVMMKHVAERFQMVDSMLGQSRILTEKLQNARCGRGCPLSNVEKGDR